MAVVGQQLSNPESGWKRYDDTHESIVYEGTWQTGSFSYAGSWNGTRHLSSNKPDKVIKFFFKGTALRVLVNTSSNRSDSVNIKIDDENYIFSTKFTTSSSIYPTYLAFEKIGLEDKFHKVVITDNTTNYIDIDAFDINIDGELRNPLSKMIVKNSVTSQYYSFSNETLIQLPSGSASNILSYGIDTDTEVQLNMPFNEFKIVENTGELIGDGKVFRYRIDLNNFKVNQISFLAKSKV